MSTPLRTQRPTSTSPRAAEHAAEHADEGAESAEHGAHEHGPAAINWTDFSDKSRPAYLGLLINFGILLALYYTMGKKGVVEGLKQRRIDIGKDIDDAKRMLDEAKERAKKYQGDLKNADVDAATAKASLVSSGKGEVEKMLTEAERESARMKRDAERLVDQERKAAPRRPAQRDDREGRRSGAEDPREASDVRRPRPSRPGAPRRARAGSPRRAEARQRRRPEQHPSEWSCNVIPGVIARRYATALLELGTETGKLDALVDEIAKAAATYDGSPELQSALANPLTPIQAKHAILNDLCTALTLSPIAKNVVQMLLDRRRIQAIVPISARLREMADEKRGLLRAEVLTAMPLPEEYFTQLQQQLERVTGRRIALDRKLDPSFHLRRRRARRRHDL